MLHGRFVNLFDSELRVLKDVTLSPGSRYFLRDLDATKGKKLQLLASACKVLPVKDDGKTISYAVESVAETPAVLLFQSSQAPKSVMLDGQPVEQTKFSMTDRLLWIRFTNEARPRRLELTF